MSAVDDVTTANFQSKVLDSGLPVLVDFWASWCGPCKQLAPVVDKLANEFAGKLSVVKLNTDENPDIAGNYGISGIPCLILFRDGKAVDRFVGFDSGARIKSMLSKHLPVS